MCQIGRCIAWISFALQSPHQNCSAQWHFLQHFLVGSILSFLSLSSLLRAMENNQMAKKLMARREKMAFGSLDAKEVSQMRPQMNDATDDVRTTITIPTTAKFIECNELRCTIIPVPRLLPVVSDFQDTQKR
eukprot:Skav219256  [mRNA]  locus=scaffold1242:371165:371560:+ [translate_table: standard]